MKFILLLAAVGVLFWLLRGSLRRRSPPQSAKPTPDKAGPKAMLQCVQCGVHLPRDEALPGQGGVFCGEAHRAAYEAAHRAP